jgi:hypothetical protein
MELPKILEFKLLQGFSGSFEGNLSCFFSTERHHIVEVVQYVIRGAYLEALNTQHCSQLFSKLCSQTFQNYVPHDPFRKLCENIESYMISEKTTAEVQFSVLLLGVICLNIFIQMNWTGPLIDVLLPLVLFCFFMRIFSFLFSNLH